MYNDLIKHLTEHEKGVPTKNIINDDEWNNFDFTLKDREFHAETDHTKQTKKSGVKSHLDIHSSVGSKVDTNEGKDTNKRTV